jgi:DMSO/TMAO reductase YedYZ molybdopterin-dependent catalytic subunit
VSASKLVTRRGLIRAGTLGAGGILLAGCDRLDQSPTFRSGLQAMDDWHLGTQRLLGRQALATEFRPADMSPIFRANGSRTGSDPAWLQQMAGGFATYALRVDGLVSRPLALPMTALQALPQRTQITRHDCVEGWSAIGKWQGPRLASVLALATSCSIVPTASARTPITNRSTWSTRTIPRRSSRGG